MHLPWGRSLRDPLTILGRESVEGAGLGMEKEVPVVAGRSAEGERPGLSLESWAGWSVQAGSRPTGAGGTDRPWAWDTLFLLLKFIYF